MTLGLYAGSFDPITKGHIDIVQLLLNHKSSNVNIRNYYNRTPLHCCADRQHTNVVKLLLNQKGIDVNV